MIRVGVIGAGAIASAHIRAYQSFSDRCEVVAAADIFPDKARELIATHGLQAYVTERYAELLADESIDLVSICTPPYTHADIAVAALRAGKHALVEKPMAASLEECDAMIAAAKDSGRILSVVAQNRFRTEMVKLKRTVETGLAGPIRHIQVNSYWWRGHSYYDLWWRGTWEREGGGCTLNHAVHHLDALVWMMGMPTEVIAVMGNVAHDNAEVEDISMALFKFAEGALGQATSSVVHHGQEQEIIFQGQAARISVPWQLYASSAKENGFPERDEELERIIQAAYDALPTLQYEYHQGQIDNVLAAIEGQQTLWIDGVQGRNTLELITAIYKAASTGQAVALPLTADDPFYTRQSLLAHVVHFYEKSMYVESFAANEITTRGNDATADGSM